MQITDKRICNVTIPAQAAGTIVLFKVQAEDTLRNQLAINGSYAVKHYSTIDLAVAKEAVTVGENITVNAVLAPEAEGMTVNVVFTTVNITKEVSATTDANGALTASFQTENVGVWQVTASFAEDATFYSSSSQRVTIRVEEPTFLAKYGIYIGGAAAGIGAACGVVIVKKRRS
jgi:hypothetical protein